VGSIIALPKLLSGKLGAGCGSILAFTTWDRTMGAGPLEVCLEGALNLDQLEGVAEGAAAAMGPLEPWGSLVTAPTRIVDTALAAVRGLPGRCGRPLATMPLLPRGTELSRPGDGERGLAQRTGGLDALEAVGDIGLIGLEGVVPSAAATPRYWPSAATRFAKLKAIT